MRVAEKVEIDEQTARESRALSKGRRVQARVRQRANVILRAAQGGQNQNIAIEVKLDRRQWRCGVGISSMAASRRRSRTRRARGPAPR